MSVERRKHKRINVAIPVRIYYLDRDVIPGDVEDISLGGAFVRCPVALPIGAEIKIELNFAGMKLLAGTVSEIETSDVSVPEKAREGAIVRWADKSNSFGMEFTGLNVETKFFLARIVEYFNRMTR